MAGNRDFEPDITTNAKFSQARTCLYDGQEMVLLDLEMLDFEPSPTSVGLRCSLDDIRTLVHSCLAALDSFGDQPASVMLKMLRRGRR